MMESRYAEYVARFGDRYSDTAESSFSDVHMDAVEQIKMEEEGLQHAVNHLLNSSFRAAPALMHRWHLQDELLNSYHYDVDAAVNHLMKLFSLGWSEDSAKGKKTYTHTHKHKSNPKTNASFDFYSYIFRFRYPAVLFGCYQH